MGRRLSPDQNTLYQRTDEVLHYLWDPCFAAGSPGARDEYYPYLPQVFELLENGANESVIADYLIGVERERMDLWPNRKRARKVAALLIEYRETIGGAAS